MKVLLREVRLLLLEYADASSGRQPARSPGATLTGMRRGWVAGICALLQVVAVATGRSVAPSPVQEALFAAVGLGTGAALLAAGRRPVLVFLACAVGYPVQALLLAPPIPAAMAVISFLLARRSPGTPELVGVPRTVAIVAAGTAVGVAGLVLAGQPYLAAPYALVVVVSSAAGLLVAYRALREESHRRELLDGQRLEIARELHDVVGHSAGAITFQAGAARVALDAGAVADATAALTDIENAGRELLREVRWMVGLLRDASAQPGLADVDRLLDHARRSGLDVRLRTAGDVTALPGEVSHEAYRILQEALTNVLRHGASATADVSLDVAESVLLRVSNPSRPDEAPVHVGSGIRGMQERAARVHGELRAGPDPGGGWLVEATLPLRVAP